MKDFNNLDLLISNKVPFEYITMSKIIKHDESLAAINENGIRYIPAEKIFILFIGYGTSVTHQAIEFASKCKLSICFTNGGIFKVLSSWSGGRWANPKLSRGQFINHLDENKRLIIAKYLILLKVKNAKEYSDFFIEGINEKIVNSKDIMELRGHEGIHARKLFKYYSDKHEKVFKRVYSSWEDTKNEDENKLINILNNCLYSFVSAIIIELGMNPSIAFCHGESRRGGLAFDIADTIKCQLVFEQSFKNHRRKLSWNMRNCSDLLSSHRGKIIKQIIKTCTLIGDADIDEKILEKI